MDQEKQDSEKENLPFNNIQKDDFKIPAGYFENLDQKILLRIKEKEELKLSAPTLFSLEKKNPFKTPDSYFENELRFDPAYTSELLNIKIKGNSFKIPPNYFENLPEKINDEILKKDETKIISLKRYISKNKYTVLAIAASIAVILVLSNINNFISVGKEEVALTADDILESHIIAEIDENTIIDEIGPQENRDQFIEEYLIENSIDETILINEL